MAVDTIYAESQRRYLETFSAYARQFMDQLDRPDVDRIEGLPPAIAVLRRAPSRSNRATVATAAEIAQHMRVLLATRGVLVCPHCARTVQRQTAESIAAELAELPQGSRAMLCFAPGGEGNLAERLAHCRALGYVRGIVGQQTVELDSIDPNAADAPTDGAGAVLVVADRLVAGKNPYERLVESVEGALEGGDGACVMLTEHVNENERVVDGRTWGVRRLSSRLACSGCGFELLDPQPRLFDSNNPYGACPRCEGFGSIVVDAPELIVPDPGKSLRSGAVAPWNTPAYAHELKELLAIADRVGLPVDIPYRELKPEHLAIVQHGVPELNFGGLDGFFNWLERRKYKLHLRVFLSRWRSYRDCPDCNGQRLRPEALAVRIQGKNFADLCRLTVEDAAEWADDLSLATTSTGPDPVLGPIRSRLGYLRLLGLGYLPLDRTLRTLSSGEAARVAMTATLGSDLVDMLYVLDEPSAGLHAADVDRLSEALKRLRDRGNTVLAIEHEEAVIDRADVAVEFGPQAGSEGGRLIYQGPPHQMLSCPESKTGDWLAGRRLVLSEREPRPCSPGWLTLQGARGANLKNIEARIPLGGLCVVTGVSGAGKSSLVLRTLVPAALRQLRRGEPDSADPPLKHDGLLGVGQIGDLVLVDQEPVARSTRSNPATYLKAMDAIRAVFAELPDSKSRGLAPGSFSFNVAGGRCETCEGVGRLDVDMQFMTDVTMVCPDCAGRRFKPEVLDVKYRGRSIAEVLDLTALDAFRFFRGQVKVQSRIKPMLDVGLDYVPLGQPASTLSGGESQRLKLAGLLGAKQQRRTLFVMDEPTTGLHMSDVTRLLDCFDALLAVGHSLLVVEHNLQVIVAADWVIDLGPGAGAAGGQIVATGTPAQIATDISLPTGRALAALIERRRRLEALPETEADSAAGRDRV